MTMKSLFAWVYISFCVAWKNLRNTPIQKALVYISSFGAWLFLFIDLFSVFEKVLQKCKMFCNNPKSNGKTRWLFVKGTQGDAHFRVGQHTLSLCKKIVLITNPNNYKTKDQTQSLTEDYASKKYISR